MQRASVKSAEKVIRHRVTAATATEMQILIGPEDGAPNFAMRRFLMAVGGGMPLHTNQIEHQQYVLAGRARVGIGCEVFEVGAGDAVFIPAEQPHFYEVLEAPFEFLCIVPNAVDTMRLVEVQD